MPREIRQPLKLHFAILQKQLSRTTAHSCGRESGGRVNLKTKKFLKIPQKNNLYGEHPVQFPHTHHNQLCIRNAIETYLVKAQPVALVSEYLPCWLGGPDPRIRIHS